MLSRLSRRLSYANVVATLALFIALGGSAYAVNTINSSDIVDGQVKSVDIANDDIQSGDVKDNSINTFDVHSFLGVDVVDGSLASADIEDYSLGNGDFLGGSVDTRVVTDDSLTEVDIVERRLFYCHAGALLFGRLCAGGGATGTVSQAFGLCASIGLRLPTFGEARLLAVNHDVPGVSGNEVFWTDEVSDATGGRVHVAVSENGGAGEYGGESFSNKIICVETPTGLD